VVQEISLFKQLPQAEQYVGTILPQEEPLETGNSFTTNITPPHFMLKLVLVNLQGSL
jgi:hypothetical protein